MGFESTRAVEEVVVVVEEETGSPKLVPWLVCAGREQVSPQKASISAYVQICNRGFFLLALENCTPRYFVGLGF